MSFEDFLVGQKFHSLSRTVGEADIVPLGMISAHWSALHSEAVHSAASPFDRRGAHGARWASRLPVDSTLRVHMMNAATRVARHSMQGMVDSANLIACRRDERRIETTL